MGSQLSYTPGIHCCVCIQFRHHELATTTVMAERRNYEACDLHAESISRHGIGAAIKRARASRNNPT